MRTPLSLYRSAVPPCPRPQSLLLPGIEGELSAPTTWPARMSNLPLSLSPSLPLSLFFPGA